MYHCIIMRLPHALASVKKAPTGSEPLIQSSAAQSAWKYLPRSVRVGFSQFIPQTIDGWS